MPVTCGSDAAKGRDDAADHARAVGPARSALATDRRRGIEPSPGYRATRLPLGVRGLYYYWRTGAGVIAPNALRYLEVK